jgi:hypothetical protein
VPILKASTILGVTRQPHLRFLGVKLNIFPKKTPIASGTLRKRVSQALDDAGVMSSNSLDVYVITIIIRLNNILNIVLLP